MSILQENFSSDSEDEDYVPDDEELSADEIVSSEASKQDSPSEAVKETIKQSVEEETKKKEDELFKNFLADVKKDEQKLRCVGESTVSCLENTASTSSTPVKSCGSEGDETNSKNTYFDFCGETIGVPKDEPGLDDVKIQPSVCPKRKGLSSVISAIESKKKKLSVLGKSQLDWMQFKNEHNIGRDLEQFNEGKGGYLERMRFLQRSDTKQYEKERDLRLSKQKRK